MWAASYKHAKISWSGLRSHRLDFNCSNIDCILKGNITTVFFFSAVKVTNWNANMWTVWFYMFLLRGVKSSGFRTDLLHVVHLSQFEVLVQHGHVGLDFEKGCSVSSLVDITDTHSRDALITYRYWVAADDACSWIGYRKNETDLFHSIRCYCLHFALISHKWSIS